MPIIVEVRANKLPQMSDALLAEVSLAVTMAALNCMSIAKDRAPKVTGNLARSIHAEPENAERTVWVVGTNVEYAPFVEFGTHRMAAQPYLTPAAEQVRPLFLSDMEEAVRRVAS